MTTKLRRTLGAAAAAAEHGSRALVLRGRGERGNNNNKKSMVVVIVGLVSPCKVVQEHVVHVMDMLICVRVYRLCTYVCMSEREGNPAKPHQAKQHKYGQTFLYHYGKAPIRV